MAVPSEPLFTPAQRRLISFALSFAAVLAIGCLVYLSLIALARFTAAFANVIWPLAVAGILGLVLRPVVGVLERRLRIGRVSAVVLLYGIFLLVLSGIIFAVAPALISQVLDLFAYLPTLWKNSLAWLESNFPDWLDVVRRHLDNPTVKSALEGLAKQAQDVFAHLVPSLKQAGAGIFNVFGFVAALAVVPVYLFFFLLSDRDPTRQLPENLNFLKEDHRDNIVFLVREFIGIIVAFFRGQLLIGLIMGILLAAGFSLAGLKFGLALGLVIGLLNIIPYLGSILGLATVLPLAFFQQDGGWTLSAICLGVFVAVQAIEGWLLTPRIMGHQTGLHPVVIIIAVFFWGQALGGVLGMLLAVPLTAFFVTAWRLARRKYFSAPSLRV